MNQVFNPYLPLYEYVPDGEPHVFGDRVYIYGSHDEAGGVIGTVSFALQEGIWTDVTVPIQAEDGEYALFFVYSGEGSFQLKEFTFQV